MNRRTLKTEVGGAFSLRVVFGRFFCLQLEPFLLTVRAILLAVGFRVSEDLD